MIVVLFDPVSQNQVLYSFFGCICRHKATTARQFLGNPYLFCLDLLLDFAVFLIKEIGGARVFKEFQALT
jgi:hypothetical protein